MITTVKNALNNLAEIAALQPLYQWFEQTRDRRAPRLRVLTYHRIGDPTSSTGDPALFSATAERFAAHLQLLRRDFHVVSLDEVLQALDGAPLPRRAVLITFDDGYRDFGECAWPLLKQLGLPATLFVPTAFPGHPDRAFWWDRLSHALRLTEREDELSGDFGRIDLQQAARERSFRMLKEHLKAIPHKTAMQYVEYIYEQLAPPRQCPHDVLDWAELRRLAAEGVTIGLHTRHHPLLSRVDDHQLTEEIVAAWRELQQQIPTAAPVFAYPAGATSIAAAQLLQRIGMRLAFTTRSGANDLSLDDRYFWRRIHVGWRTTTNVLRAKLARAIAWNS